VWEEIVSPGMHEALQRILSYDNAPQKHMPANDEGEKIPPSAFEKSHKRYIISNTHATYALVRVE
jgi:hypothetical protein